MDEIDFYKYLQIPILKEIEKKFEVEETDLLKTFVQFLFNGFWINSKTTSIHHPLPSRANPYALGAMNAINEEKIRENGMYLEDLLRRDEGKTLVKHMHKMQKKFDKLNPETNLMKGKKEADFMEIDVSDHVVSYFDSEDVWNRAKFFKFYLKSRIAELEEFVRNEEKSDEELLNMI